jgi:hypothetical protein
LRTQAKVNQGEIEIASSGLRQGILGVSYRDDIMAFGLKGYAKGFSNVGFIIYYQNGKEPGKIHVLSEPSLDCDRIDRITCFFILYIL